MNSTCGESPYATRSLRLAALILRLLSQCASRSLGLPPRIKSRAVTLNDYADLAMQVPGVAKSVSYGTVYTAVQVVIAPIDGKGDDELHDQAVRFRSRTT